MSAWIVALVALAYLTLLFGIGYWAEWRSKKGKSLVNNPYVYALSMTVFCTAWTYYGSVGQTSEGGLYFLATYLGPTIAAPLFVILLRKMVRISRLHHTTTIADFISSRYGKNFSLGALVSVLCAIGIIPYIAIQLKAISSSMALISMGNHTPTLVDHSYITVYVAIALAVFTILFGTRSIDSSERHEGMVAAVAFESIVKLIAFLALGIFVVYGLFNGWGDVFAQLPDEANRYTLDEENGYLRFFILTLLSFSAFLMLPRQFQVGVVENLKESHITKATWLLPLYLFLINLFVLPIAVAGIAIFQGSVDPDTFVLALPLESSPGLALFVMIGGFSAATSMIIVETIALSTMLSSNIVMPLLLARRSFSEKGMNISLMRIRRASILFIVLAAYLFERFIAEQVPLVSIGMVSFAAVAQFAPAMLGGMYWKQATRKGAISAIVVGFIIWFYTLILPLFVNTGYVSEELMTEGLFGFSLLKPHALFGLNGFDPISHAAVWSLLFNLVTYFGVSLFTKRDNQETVQAELFVDVFLHSTQTDDSVSWKGTAYIKDLRSLLGNFLGQERADNLLQSYANRHQINLSRNEADPRLVSFSERILSGVIGNASAHIMVRSVVQEEKISTDEIIRLLQESKQMREMNKTLQRQQDELQKASEQLTLVNEQLKEMDELKDEFLYTVTHELRTPLTSIRALAEIVHDNPDMTEEERGHYLSGVVTESERLSHLITQVLKLEKYESGRQKLYLQPVQLDELIHGVVRSVQPLAKDRGITITTHIPNQMHLVQGDSDLLTQVVYNLVTNAIKFSPEQTGHIQIRVVTLTDEIEVSVEDNGKGIHIEVHDLIFDKFFQARNQTLQKPEGSGLGLAICKRIIEMHHGRIRVDSPKGKGACFTFVLPL